MCDTASHNNTTTNSCSSNGCCPSAGLGQPTVEKTLGSWTKNTAKLAEQFGTASPYPHVIVEDFFSPETALALYNSFPSNSDPRYHRYWNPMEKKLALDRFGDLPFVKSVFDLLQTEEVVRLMSLISQIDQLEADPFLHGAGLHCMPSGGKLDMHLDYSVHPISGKERRLNLIVYLNPEWDADNWNGQLELWDAKFDGTGIKVPPVFNTACLFRTTDQSFHGVPAVIRCPPEQGRKSLAIYYVSPLQPTATQRYRAQFFPRPDQPTTPGLMKLYALRPHRRIEPADLLEHLGPDWDSMPEGENYWW